MDGRKNGMESGRAAEQEAVARAAVPAVCGGEAGPAVRGGEAGPAVCDGEAGPAVRGGGAGPAVRGGEAGAAGRALALDEAALAARVMEELAAMAFGERQYPETDRSGHMELRPAGAAQRLKAMELLGKRLGLFTGGAEGAPDGALDVCIRVVE